MAQERGISGAVAQVSKQCAGGGVSDSRMIDTEQLIRAQAALKRSEAYERQGDAKNAHTAAVEAAVWLGKWIEELQGAQR